MKEKQPIVKTTIRVPKPLWDSVRIAAVKESTTAEALVIKALTQYLKGGK